MSYVKTNWANEAAPAVNATALNKIEQGIYDAHVLATTAQAAADAAQGTASAAVPKSLVAAAEDLIVGSGAGAVKRLAKGSNGQVLGVAGGALAYSTPPGAEITSWQLAADGAPTGVTGTGTGDTFAVLPAATFENVKHYLEGNVYIEDNGGNALLQFYLMIGTTQIFTWYYRTPATNPGPPAFVRAPIVPNGLTTFSVKYRDATGGRIYTARAGYGGCNFRIVKA